MDEERGRQGCWNSQVKPLEERKLERETGGRASDWRSERHGLVGTSEPPLAEDAAAAVQGVELMPVCYLLHVSLRPVD